MRIFAPALALSLLVQTPALAKKAPQLTPMEIQALQSREFETTKDILFASVVSVFQDLGYQLENADLGSGFITASSASTNKTSVWEALGSSASYGNTRATAFVEQISTGKSKVRLNFLNTKSSSGMYGMSSKKDTPILDPQTYRGAWEKIDEAIFVRGGAKLEASSAPKADAAPVTMEQTPKVSSPQ